MSFNHVNDPSYFYDAIEEFAFNYDIYVVVDKSEIDDYGCIKTEYSKQTIRGSLQSQGTQIVRSKEGNTQERRYNFYCKSLYRINIGDFISYQGNYLLVDNIHDYDEWGVRQASCKMIQLTSYRDLADYIAYIEGTKIV